jgi:hypothetical protein
MLVWLDSLCVTISRILCCVLLVLLKLSAVLPLLVLLLLPGW